MILRRDVSDGGGAHHGTTDEVSRRRPDCLWPDCVWCGSPQWQIDALWRFQIPEEMRKSTAIPSSRSRPSGRFRSQLGRALRHQAARRRGEGQGTSPCRRITSKISKELKRSWSSPYTADNMSTFKEKYWRAAVNAATPDTGGCGRTSSATTARAATRIAGADAVDCNRYRPLLSGCRFAAKRHRRPLHPGRHGRAVLPGAEWLDLERAAQPRGPGRTKPRRRAERSRRVAARCPPRNRGSH